MSAINGTSKQELYDQLLKVAQRKTAEADTKLDRRGRKIDENDEEDFGDNVLIVEQSPESLLANSESDPQKKLF